MTSRILPALSAFATLTLFSCYPYPEPPPRDHHKRPDQQKTVTDAEQQKIKDQRDRMKEAAKREEEAQAKNNVDPSATNSTTPPKPPEKKNVPTAQPVPGKEGFVFSPFNNKVIDVRDMPSGTLVADPTYPASDKKHFRVP